MSIITISRFGDYEVQTEEIRETVNGTVLDSVWQAGPPRETHDGALVLGFGQTRRDAVADYFRAWVARYQVMPPSVQDRELR